MDEFESFLAENRDRRLYVVNPGGSKGDTLIHMGLVKKLKEFGIQHYCMHLEEAYKRHVGLGAKYLLNIVAFKMGLHSSIGVFKIPEDVDVILFEGGGYMNDLYFGLPLLKAALKIFEKPIAVAPQSFWFSRSNFKNLISNGRQEIVLFCREKYSFGILSDLGLPNNVEVRLSKDNALYLTKHDLNGFVSSKNEDAHDAYNLVCFRRDKESVIPGGERRRIIRMAGKDANKLLMSDIAKWKLFSSYVSAVANAKIIYTDRLHVAILAHIFGKEFTLFDNCYHKNRGVYEYSLMGDSKARFKELTA